MTSRAAKLLTALSAGTLLGLVPNLMAQATLNPLGTFGSSGYLTPPVGTYLTVSGDGQRGLGYDSVLNRLYLISSRSAGTVQILDGDTGAAGSTLSTGGIITGGTAALNVLGVADDGAIYAANLTTAASGSSPLKVYRWASAAATPTLIYSDSSSNLRYGDSIDVRGSGASTQIILATGTAVVPRITILTTADGSAFSGTTLVPDFVAATGAFRQGLSFGAGNTIFAKQTGSGNPLYSLSFDVGAGSLSSNFAVPTSVISSSIGALGVDVANGILVGLQGETANDTVRVFQLNSLSSSSAPVSDTETFAANNANGSAIGAVAAGGNRVYILDVNNGIGAFDVIAVPVPEPGTLALAALGAGLLVRGLRRKTS